MPRTGAEMSDNIQYVVLLCDVGLTIGVLYLNNCSKLLFYQIETLMQQQKTSKRITVKPALDERQRIKSKSY